jgi:hypothetical protein
MRPFFIHNYEKELIEKKEEFLDLFMKEGDLWEKLYMNDSQNDASIIEDPRVQKG